MANAEIEKLQQVIIEERDKNVLLLNQNAELIKQVGILTESVKRLEIQVSLLLDEQKANKPKANITKKRQADESFGIFPDRTKSLRFSQENNDSMDTSGESTSGDKSNEIKNNVNSVTENDLNGNSNSPIQPSNMDSNGEVSANDNGITVGPNETNKVTVSADMHRNEDDKRDDFADELLNGNVNINNWQRVSYKNTKNENRVKIQPIHVKNADFKMLYDLLIKHIGLNKFTINQINGNVKIFSNTMETYRDIGGLFRSKSIKFHTYLHDDEKRTCFLIRGLPEISLGPVRNELIRYGLPSDIHISEFISGYQRQHPEIKHKCLIKMILPPKTNANILKSIKTIFGIAVSFEKFNSNGIIQCKRCQNYFHTASRCFLEFRCVKCLDPHEPGKCAKSIDAPPLCVNCSGQHSANDHQNCQFFIEKIQPKLSNNKSGINIQNSKRKSGVKNIIKPATGGSINSNKRKSVSYADVVAGNTSDNKRKNGNSNNQNMNSGINHGDLGNNNEVITLLTSLLVRFDQFLSKQN